MAGAKRLLDLIVGAIATPRDLDQTRAVPATGRSADRLVTMAKDFVKRNPGLAEAALMSVAGLLLRTPKGRGLRRGLAGIGGLALIGGVAYQAFQNYRAGKPWMDTPQGAAGGRADAPGPFLSLAGSSFDPASVSEEDALLFARAMVAAASADGRIDEAERARIVSGIAQAGLDDEGGRWLERELASPATIDELADPIETPEKAAQLYAAARVAIDPDTMQEREFLRQLAEALDLDPQLRNHIDEAAAGARSEAPAGA